MQVPARKDAPEFGDYLDGYFPLRVSIADLMRRRGLTQTRLYLAFAPIMHVEGLPPDAPVPLSIKSGRAGMIDHAWLNVRYREGALILSGRAQWRWLDGTAVAAQFDPMTRLAEPAYAEGYSVTDAATPENIVTIFR